MGGLEGEHGLGHGLHGHAEGLGVGQQGRDVAEEDPRFREIRHIADIGGKGGGKGHGYL